MARSAPTLLRSIALFALAYVVVAQGALAGACPHHVASVGTGAAVICAFDQARDDSDPAAPDRPAVCCLQGCATPAFALAGPGGSHDAILRPAERDFVATEGAPAVGQAAPLRWRFGARAPPRLA